MKTTSRDRVLPGASLSCNAGPCTIGLLRSHVTTRRLRHCSQVVVLRPEPLHGSGNLGKYGCATRRASFSSLLRPYTSKSFDHSRIKRLHQRITYRDAMLRSLKFLSRVCMHRRTTAVQHRQIPQCNAGTKFHCCRYALGELMTSAP